MGYVFNPETGAMEWVQSSITPPNAELEQQAQDDYEARRKAASQDVINEAMTKPDYLANDERYLKDLGRTIAEKESAVPLAPKVPGVVTELDVSGSKRPVVSQAEGFNRPVSAQEVIAKTAPVKELTPEEQRYKLMRLRDQRIALDIDKYEREKQAKLAAIAPSGIMDGDKMRMYVASTNKAATPYTLNAYKNSFDGMHDSRIEVSPEDLAIASQPLSSTDLTSFNAKGKTHITGFGQEATASYYRFRTAVQQDFEQGKAKADVALKALGRTPTIDEWNTIINQSYSNVTRATARMNMPKEMLENVDVVEANRVPLAAALVTEYGITPAEAQARANRPDIASDPDYIKFDQQRRPGWFRKGPDGKPEIIKWNEAQYKEEHDKQAYANAKQRLRSGLVVDHKDKAIQKLYKDFGSEDIINFAEKDATFDRTKQWKGNPKGTVATNLSADAVDTVTKMAMENIKTQDMGQSIDSAIGVGITSGALKGLEKDDAYASFANKVYDRMNALNEKKNQDLRINVDEQEASEMGDLNKMLSETDKDGNVKANPNTFRGFVIDDARAMVVDNKVNVGNIDQKTREILERKIGLSTDTVQGLALHQQLSLPDRTEMSNEVGAAYDFIKTYLMAGINQETMVKVKVKDEEKKQAEKEELIKAEYAKAGQTVVWDRSGASPVPVAFKNDAKGIANKEQYEHAGTEDRKNIAKMESDRISKYSDTKVSLGEDLAMLKRGMAIQEVMTKPAIAFPKKAAEFKQEYMDPASVTAIDWERTEKHLLTKYGAYSDIYKEAHDEYIKAREKWEDGVAVKLSGEKDKITREEKYQMKVGISQALRDLDILSGLSSDKEIKNELKKYEKKYPGIGEFILPKGTQPLGEGVGRFEKITPETNKSVPGTVAIKFPDGKIKSVPSGDTEKWVKLGGVIQ